MAEYMIQDTTLTGLGDAIRAQEKSTGTIPVGELASRISALGTGTEVQKKSGIFTTNNLGYCQVDCGFKPDIVSITQKISGGGNSQNSVAFSLLEYAGKDIIAYMYVETDAGEALFQFDVSEASWSTSGEDSGIGFIATVYKTFDYEKEEITMEEVVAATFQYVAYKFT